MTTGQILGFRNRVDNFAAEIQGFAGDFQLGNWDCCVNLLSPVWAAQG
jgi:hypothetical protein